MKLNGSADMCRLLIFNPSLEYSEVNTVAADGRGPGSLGTEIRKFTRGPFY